VSLAGPRAFRFLAPALLLLGSALPARAASAQMAVEVCDPRTLFLRRQDAVWRPDAYKVELFRLPEDPRGAPLLLGVTDAEPAGRLYLRAGLDAPLPNGAALRVVVRDAAGNAVTVAEASTRPRATLQRSGAGTEARSVFEVQSSTPLAALTSGDGLTLVEVVRERRFRRGAGGGPEEVPEVTRSHRVVLRKEIPEAACDGPAENQRLAVALPAGERLRESSEALRLVGLRDRFGNEVLAGGALPPPAVPRGKEDATLYADLFFAKAPGAPETLAADLKLQPALELLPWNGAWLFQPELTAEVAKNLAPAPDSIRAAALFSRTDLVRRGLLATSTVSLGPSIEADRGLDRVNGILDLRWKPGLAGLYHPRENRRNDLARELGRTPGEVVPPLTGWGLDGELGAEAGRSLRRQTLGGAVAPYDVLRPRAAVHGFYQLGPLTLDLASGLRYLAATELTPQRAGGFRPSTEATLSWALDAAQHLSLGLTWQDGSEPPVFVKVQRVSAGIVVKD
jgi:hypothetical protein